MRDSFQHMLQCYQLEEEVTRGAEVVPFLVKMAKVTNIPEGTKRIPYMVEYSPEGGEEETMDIEHENEQDRDESEAS